MNFSDKTFETLASFEGAFQTACNSDWCANPGRAALELMADALAEKDGRRTFINHSCGSCILHVVKRTGYLYFEDKAARETAAAEKKSIAPDLTAARLRAEAPKPTKTAPKKKTASTAKRTTKK